jgi:hypothetical protein
VSGNAELSSNLTVSGDATMSGDATVSGNVEVGAANLFVDTTTGNVGIGTNSPQDTLHLYGSPLIQHSDSYNLSSAGWRKIGTFTASEAGARLKIRILGSFQYGAGSSRGGQTEIYGSINNGVGTVCNMSGTYNYIGQPAVTSVKFVQTGASELEYEVRAYFQTVTAHSFSVECTRGVFVRSWTASSDPGNNSSTVEAAILTHNISENGKLDVNGVIKNQNPSWNLYMTGTPSPTTSGILKFNFIRAPVINCSLNTSGGLTSQVDITVAGRYFIGFNAFTEGSVGEGAGMDHTVRINGNSYVRNYHTQPITGYSAMGGLGCLADLEVGDYVQIYSLHPVHYNANSSFYGFMIS